MNPWVAIVGHGREGRRALTRQVADALRAEGVALGGFLHERLDEGERHTGYDAVSLASGERHPLVRTAPDPEMCDYAFSSGVFDACRRWATADDAQAVFVEAGRLEAHGRGHWDTIRAVLEGPPRVLVLSVRPHILVPVVLSLSDPEDGLEMPCDQSDIDAFVAGIVRQVSALAT